MGRKVLLPLTGSQEKLSRINLGKFAYQPGFALLEILLAFAISVFVLGIALPAISQTVTKLTEFRSHSTALTLARLKLEEYASEYAVMPRHYQGVQNGFFWQVSIENRVPDAIEGPFIGIIFLQKIDVKIAANEQVEPLISLSTHRLAGLKQ